ncbi:hypothetical protein XENOCAPTIV_025073, partial [Xenoophorus captivus]
SLILFNPTEQHRTTVINLVVNSPDAHIADAETGRPIAAQISAVWVEPSKVSAEAFQVQFLWYGTRTSGDKSGAYLFLPGVEGPQVSHSHHARTLSLSFCPLIHGEWHAGKSLEISNTVDIRSETNRELVMRIMSDVTSGNRFYTDLNGFQVFTDSTSRLSLLSAQSQAVASLRSG